MTARREKIVLPLIAVLLGFLLGSIIVIATGRSPLAMIGAIVKGFTGIDLLNPDVPFNPRYIGEFIIQAMPIILTGLAFAFASRTGLFSIGAEGQLMMGSLAATAVALLVKAPKVVHLPLVLLAAILAGALWGAIPGLLKAAFNVHEVVVTIMMNYIALHVNNYTILNIFGSVDRIKTAPFAPTALLKDPWLESITNGSRLNWGFIPVILALLIFSFIINRTTFGFSLRAVGYNKEAARYAGMKVNRNIVASMMIAGAFAGLAGAVITVGTFTFGRALPSAEGYGFDGIAVALVGGNEALGILLAGMLFGGLKAAQPLMQSQGIPREIAGIIQASIVLFVAMKFGIKMVLQKFERKQAPSTEGDRV
ncbi:MAG: ABC transporter permease [Rectinemataceae bacterium]|nr:ABC transporter permease [Spirochaetaceae bacterium]